MVLEILELNILIRSILLLFIPHSEKNYPCCSYITVLIKNGHLYLKVSSANAWFLNGFSAILFFTFLPCNKIEFKRKTRRFLNGCQMFLMLTATLENISTLIKYNMHHRCSIAKEKHGINFSQFPGL